MSDIDETRKLLRIAEDGRRRAELELLEARDKFAKDIDYVSRLRTERCGIFHRRTLEEIRDSEHPLIESAHPGNHFHGDWIIMRASQEARLSGIAQADNYSIAAGRWCRLPQEVQAESWWHLCAQVGLEEFLARVLYTSEKRSRGE